MIWGIKWASCIFCHTILRFRVFLVGSVSFVLMTFVYCLLEDLDSVVLNEFVTVNSEISSNPSNGVLKISIEHFIPFLHLVIFLRSIINVIITISNSTKWQSAVERIINER